MTDKKIIPEEHYFHGEIARNFDFYQMPSFIMTHPVYSKISDSAKIMYLLLFNRMRLSVANGWSDEKGRTYIIYSNDCIMKDMNMGRTKTTNVFMELVNLGLIEKVRVLNKPSRIYVMNFMEFAAEIKEISRDKEIEEIAENSCILPSTANRTDSETESDISVNPKSVSQSTATDGDNKIYINNNKYSHIYTNHIYPTDEADGCDVNATESDYERYMELIKDNIAYDDICYTHSEGEIECLDEIVELMTETVTFNDKPIKINGSFYPASVVKSRFLKLDQADIENVIGWFYSPEGKTGAYERIGNIRAYMLSMLFNSKTTRNTAFQNFFNATYYGDYKVR